MWERERSLAGLRSEWFLRWMTCRYMIHMIVCLLNSWQTTFLCCCVVLYISFMSGSLGMASKVLLMSMVVSVRFACHLALTPSCYVLCDVCE